MSGFAPSSRLVNDVRPSPNHDQREQGAALDILLLHYTGMASSAAALDLLCAAGPGIEHRVSTHYFVCEDGRIIQCVPEDQRAWHAGQSTWEGKPDVNSRSIGLEIANPGHDFGYPDFPDQQITAVIALCRDVIARWRIRADRILAHSDVAPARKRDPGEKFPWARLFAEGIGLWVEPESPDEEPSSGCGEGPALLELQAGLTAYGYGLTRTGSCDLATGQVLAAFQRHFRPARVDGRPDRSTASTLRRLLYLKRLAIGCDRLTFPL